MEIDKLEAARRQIETSIEMYFLDKDFVSLHTLTGAANEILRDIGNLKGIKSMKEQLLDMARPEKKKEVRALLNRSQNFFKHADKDPEESLNFELEEAYMFIFDNCLMYEKLAGKATKIMDGFTVWVRMKTPDYFIWNEESKEVFDRTKAMHGLLLEDKGLYFRTIKDLS